VFGQRHRFHGYNSLKAVYARGQTVRGQQLSLKYAQRETSRPYRVAVVVSRKVSKSAVVRNRIRRRVYEQIRQLADGIKPGSDLVFTAYSDQLAELETPKLASIIKDLLDKTDRPSGV
jgi:ribonuclease P protein component